MVNCQHCDHKNNPEGGHCYMFRTAPTGQYCAQYTPTDAIRQRKMLLKQIDKCPVDVDQPIE